MSTMTAVLDTTPKAEGILDEFLAALKNVQEEITDLDGASFGCFPFGYSHGNKTCLEADSPVCVLCRELQPYSKTKGE